MNPYGADRYLGSERIHSRQINEVVEGLICVFVEEILGFFVIGGIVDGISSRSVEVKMPSVPSFARRKGSYNLIVRVFLIEVARKGKVEDALLYSGSGEYRII
jgi:hypothetical protein